MTINKIIDGLIEFRKKFHGEIWLEVFIIPNLNDTNDELQKIKCAIEKIKPDRVQLNTLDRPGTENWVMPAKKEELEKIASFLNAEVIANFKSRKKLRVSVKILKTT